MFDFRYNQALSQERSVTKKVDCKVMRACELSEARGDILTLLNSPLNNSISHAVLYFTFLYTPLKWNLGQQNLSELTDFDCSPGGLEEIS